MNYVTIKYNDIVNGTGVRTTLFVSGCTHQCDACFSKAAWDFNYGEKYTPDTEEQIISSLEPSYIKGITLLGGEPFELANQPELIRLTRRIAKELPNKDIWCFSGYTFEELTQGKMAQHKTTMELLENIDVLVDGKFEKAKKDPLLLFRGSSNQKIIDVKKSLKSGKTVLLEEFK